jgi:hypothetical protein
MDVISGLHRGDPGHDLHMLRTTLMVAALLAVLPVSAQAVRHGHVRLTGFSPAVVHGSGFYARERVTVTLRGASSVMIGHATTTAGGAFTMRFGRAAPAAGCQGLAVSVVGARGDQAAWKSAPQVCGTPLAP